MLPTNMSGDSPVKDEAALGIVHETEMLVRLLDRDNVHESDRVVDIGANLAVDLDEALHEDGLDLLVGERVLQAVAKDEDKGKALAELVRAGRRARGPGSSHLVKHPVLGRIEALHVSLWSTSHGA